MRKLLFTSTAIAAVTLIAPLARAADPMTGEPQGTVAPTENGLMGTVKEVDKTKNMVTITVPLAPGASVMREGKSVSLDQLKKGDDIRASFDPTTSAITQIQAAPKGKMRVNTTP